MAREMSVAGGFGAEAFLLVAFMVWARYREGSGNCRGKSSENSPEHGQPAFRWPTLVARAGRVVHAERHFGDIRFVMGSGQAMRWLEMYAGTNLVAAFRGFDAEEVSLSPDGRYFLAVSNSHLSTMAFAVLDRQGHIVFSAPYQTTRLRHCPGTAAIERHWMDAANLQARFELAQSQTDPAHREYLQSVTVRGCDGRDTLLGQAADPGPPAVDLRVSRLMPAAPAPPSKTCGGSTRLSGGAR